MNSESAPKQSPDQTPPQEQQAERGVLSNESKNRIADLVQSFQENISDGSLKVKPEKARRNIASSIASIICAETKWERERALELAQKLTEMNPTEIRNTDILESPNQSPEPIADLLEKEENEPLEEFPIEVDLPAVTNESTEEASPTEEASSEEGLATPENFPNVEDVVRRNSVVQAIEAYNVALAKYERSKKDPSARAELFYADEGIARAIKDELYFDLNINNPAYVQLRNAAINLLIDKERSFNAGEKGLSERESDAEFASSLEEVMVSRFEEKVEDLELTLPPDYKEAIHKWIEQARENRPEILRSLPAIINSADTEERIHEKEEEIEALDKKLDESNWRASERFHSQKQVVDDLVARKGMGIKEKILDKLSFASYLVRAIRNRKNIREEVLLQRKRDLKAKRLKTRHNKKHSLTLEDMREYAQRRARRTDRGFERSARLESNIAMAENGLAILRAQAFSDLEPIREAKDDLRAQASKRLKELMSGNLESLQKAQEFLEEMKKNKLVDYFSKDSKEYLDTAEINEDGEHKMKDGVPTRSGRALIRPDEIQREINFQIQGEVTTMLEDKIDELAEKGILDDAEDLLKDVLEMKIGSKSKENSKKFLSRLLEMKIISLQHEGEKNAPLILKIRQLQQKYLSPNT